MPFPARTMPRSGVMIEATVADTKSVKALPITNAIARAKMLPFMINALNSSRIFIIANRMAQPHTRQVKREDGNVSAAKGRDVAGRGGRMNPGWRRFLPRLRRSPSFSLHMKRLALFLASSAAALAVDLPPPADRAVDFV